MQKQDGQNARIQLVGKYSATLSLVEIALGSILHSFHVPFAGNFLSLNQGFLLCRASLEARVLIPEENPSSLALGVSNVAAVLKSLSPAGKKLGPMLSLSMQGFLFFCGVFLFGINLVGLCVGMTMLSLWTFLQPLLTYYFFFGAQLISAIEYLYQKTLPYHGLKAEVLLAIFLTLLTVKILFAISLAIVAVKIPHSGLIQDQLLEIAREKGAKPRSEGKGSKVWLAIKDLFNPLFLFSFITTLIFIYFSEHTKAQMIWVMLRPLAIGFLFFYFSRTMRIEPILAYAQGTRFETFVKSCAVALQDFKKISTK